MQGTMTVNRLPIRSFAIILAATAVLILGVLAGYALRGLSLSAASAVGRANVVSVQHSAAAPAQSAQADQASQDRPPFKHGFSY